LCLRELDTNSACAKMREKNDRCRKIINVKNKLGK